MYRPRDLDLSLGLDFDEPLLLLSCLAPLEVEADLGALLDELPAFAVLAAVAAAGFATPFLVPGPASSSDASPPKLVMNVISPAFCGGDRDLERELD